MNFLSYPDPSIIHGVSTSTMLHPPPLQSAAKSPLPETTRPESPVFIPIEGPPILSDSFCKCGRRHLIPSMAAAAAALLPVPSAVASRFDSSSSSSTRVLGKILPSRPDWYEEFYALAMYNSMKAYEAEIASYKSRLFSEVRGKASEILEIGIGTGPNLKYYAGNGSMRVFGVDPNRKMEKYARAAVEDAGLPQENFEFLQAVGEDLPLANSSMDAVIGTLVLCSVTDVKRTLGEVKRVLKPGGIYVFVEHVGAKDGTFLRFLQNILDPVQQFVADGCHLTRDTAKLIAEAEFSQVDSRMIFVSEASLINPHVYGKASK